MRHEPPPEKGCDDRRAENDAERREGEVATGRHPRKPGMKRLEFSFDDREVRGGLTDLAQGERVIWLANGMREDG